MIKTEIYNQYYNIKPEKENISIINNSNAVLKPGGYFLFLFFLLPRLSVQS